jgi:hypothetical protein
MYTRGLPASKTARVRHDFHLKVVITGLAFKTAQKIASDSHPPATDSGGRGYLHIHSDSAALKMFTGFDKLTHHPTAHGIARTAKNCTPPRCLNRCNLDTPPFWGRASC